MWRDDAFLPHGIWRDSEAAEHPVLLTFGEDNPNGAAVRFLIEGAAMPENASAYERVVFLFDGEDAEALEAARRRWSEAKRAGFAVTYWQGGEKGSVRRH